MGLDISGIELVIHYGPAMDLDDFLQETGRASRSQGSQATSIVLLYPGSLNSQHITPAMKEMLRTKTCRRECILKHYMDSPEAVTPLHNCCDNCERLCECGDCPQSPLNKLGIVANKQEEDGDEEEGDEEEDDVASSSGSENNDSDSDSDMEVYKRKPIVLSYDSD
jgi:superfamily II DNA helicase RecQ